MLRRFAVICAVALWIGGFTFYSSFAIPAATEQLGSAREAGFITQKVTNSLNVCGVIALGFLFWNVGAVWRAMSTRERHALGWTLGLLTIADITLLLLHPQLEARLDMATQTILPKRNFYAYHRAYLWISTAQWGVALLHVWIVLAIWRRQDRTLEQPEEVRF